MAGLFHSSRPKPSPPVAQSAKPATCVSGLLDGTYAFAPTQYTKPDTQKVNYFDFPMQARADLGDDVNTRDAMIRLLKSFQVTFEQVDCSRLRVHVRGQIPKTDPALFPGTTPSNTEQIYEIRLDSLNSEESVTWKDHFVTFARKTSYFGGSKEYTIEILRLPNDDLLITQKKTTTNLLPAPIPNTETDEFVLEHKSISTQNP